MSASISVAALAERWASSHLPGENREATYPLAAGWTLSGMGHM
jgi:hypothetical protein